MTGKPMKIAILGNGISGITAARHIRKACDHDITVISDESDQFFSRTALMYVYMGHMRLPDTQPYEPWFWDKNRINLLRTRIESIDFSQQQLHDNQGKTIPYDALILALGSKSAKFDWPGQDLDGVHGLYHLRDLEAMERHSKGLERAVINGGGLIGVEMAEMFHSRGIPVSFLVREPSFWNSVLPAEESAMVNRHLIEHHIDLQLNTSLDHILGDPDGKCRSVITSQGTEIPCGFVGLTTGVLPNIQWLKNTSLETNRGILVDEFLQTNLPGVYAIGDCAEFRSPPPGRRPIEPVWYTGRIMGQTVAATLTGQKTAYNPGIWFNSAKFFDIEYQIYGTIHPTLPSGFDAVYWEHPLGKSSIRIEYEKASGRVTGFNLMGVRYRQDICTRWIQQNTPIENVLPNLGLANFDPEFSPQYEEKLIDIYNLKTGKSIRPRQKRSLESLLQFLRK
jgi:NADPH-dependent 2,4-dienoyl-CoA reductase/sulfur reductase-like enzyme